MLMTPREAVSQPCPSRQVRLSDAHKFKDEARRSLDDVPTLLTQRRPDAKSVLPPVLCLNESSPKNGTPSQCATPVSWTPEEDSSPMRPTLRSLIANSPSGAMSPVRHKASTPPGASVRSEDLLARRKSTRRRLSRTLSRDLEVSVPTVPCSIPWPHRLREKQGLECDRGDVLVINKVQHAVVGFDGRNEAYICWKADAMGAFDTTPKLIPRNKAHRAPQNPHVRDRVPRLPDLDHMGRIAEDKDTSKDSNKEGQEGSNAHSRKATAPPGSATAAFRRGMRHNASPADVAPSELTAEVVAMASAQERSGVLEDLPSTQEVASSFARDHASFAPLQEGMRAEASQEVLTDSASKEVIDVTGRFDGDCDAEAHPWCSLWGLSQSLALPLAHVVARAASTLLPRAGSRAALLDADSQDRAAASPLPAGLGVRIPIVRPACWKELQPIMAGQSIVFDERGWKEAMTVRGSAWASFVDRQCAKLQREIQDIKVAAGAGGTTEAVEELAELEGLLESMADWKELSRFSGKSVTMTSTSRGSEMKIHVLAFTEREDGGGVDFMRLCYRKSSEVCQDVLLEECRRNPDLEKVLRGIMPTSTPQDVAEVVGHTSKLLERPDIAKYVIAVAFQAALASEGVQLHFCEALLCSLAEEWHGVEFILA